MGVLCVRILVRRLGIQLTINTGIYLLLACWSIILVLQMFTIQTPAIYMLPVFCCSFSSGVVLSLAPGQAMVPFSHNAGAASSVFGILQYGGSALLASVWGFFYEATPLSVTVAITICAVMTLISYRFFNDSIIEHPAA